MAKTSSLFTFIAGGILGAAAVYLTCTENGKKILEDGRTKFGDFLDSLDAESAGDSAQNVSEDGIIDDQQ